MVNSNYYAMVSWSSITTAAKVQSLCWTALLPAWESLGWVPLPLLLLLLSTTSCCCEDPTGAHVLDPPVPVGSLPSTQQVHSWQTALA